MLFRIFEKYEFGHTNSYLGHIWADLEIQIHNSDRFCANCMPIRIVLLPKRPKLYSPAHSALAICSLLPGEAAPKHAIVSVRLTNFYGIESLP